MKKKSLYHRHQEERHDVVVVRQVVDVRLIAVAGIVDNNGVVDAVAAPVVAVAVVEGVSPLGAVGRVPDLNARIIIKTSYKS